MPQTSLMSISIKGTEQCALQVSTLDVGEGSKLTHAVVLQYNNVMLYSLLLHWSMSQLIRQLQTWGTKLPPSLGEGTHHVIGLQRRYLAQCTARTPLDS